MAGPIITLDVLDVLLADTGEAPRTDCCKPMGMPFDRTTCPADDETTDRLAALAAEIDGWSMSVGVRS